MSVQAAFIWFNILSLAKGNYRQERQFVNEF